MTAEWVRELTKTPGVLGCAYLSNDTVVCDLGEAIGGESAVTTAQDAVQACMNWRDAQNTDSMQTAIFVGERGRLLAQVVGSGMLIAFAENESSAGLLRLRLQETAEKIMNSGESAS